VEQLQHLILVFRLVTARQTALQVAVQVAQARQVQGQQARLALGAHRVRVYRLALFQVVQKLQLLAVAVAARAGQGQAVLALTAVGLAHRHLTEQVRQALLIEVVAVAAATVQVQARQGRQVCAT